MMELRYDKHYYEAYAALTLSRCFALPYAAIHMGERPDLQLPRLGIGVEVTQALTSYDGQFASVVGRALGRPYSFEAIQTALERLAGSGLTNAVDWAAALPGIAHPLDMDRHYALIRERILHKRRKLPGYTHFRQNDLYIFAHTRLIRAPRLHGLLLAQDQNSGPAFDYIYVNAIDHIYRYTSGAAFEVRAVEPGELDTLDRLAHARAALRRLPPTGD